MNNRIFVPSSIATSKVLRIGEVCYTKYRPAVEMPTISSGEPLNDCRDCVESSSSDSSSDSSSSWSSTSSESSYSSESSDSGDSTTSEPSSPSESSSSQPSEPSSSGPGPYCHHLFRVRYDCETNTFGTVALIESDCGNTFGHPVNQWVKVDDDGSSSGGGSGSDNSSSGGPGCVYEFVAVGLPCASVAHCNDFPPAEPNPPDEPFDCDCPAPCECPEEILEEYTVNFTFESTNYSIVVPRVGSCSWNDLYHPGNRSVVIDMALDAVNCRWVIGFSHVFGSPVTPSENVYKTTGNTPVGGYTGGSAYTNVTVD